MCKCRMGRKHAGIRGTNTGSQAAIGGERAGVRWGAKCAGMTGGTHRLSLGVHTPIRRDTGLGGKHKQGRNPLSQLFPCWTAHA